MSMQFKKIGLAIAFSPTSQALVKEAARLATLYEAKLFLVHVGKKGATEEKLMQELVDMIMVVPTVLWREGNPVTEILSFCKSEAIDLLLAGALKKENLLQNYIGTVARKIMRKADCSILMIQNPSEERAPIQNIVVNAEDSPYVPQAIEVACYIAQLENAQWVHITRDIKLLGLVLTANEQCTEDEYHKSMQHLVREEVEEVEKILSRVSHQNLKVNIKMLSGKPGYELAVFSERKKADLLIVGAPERRLSLLDRLFPHDLEYIFANLPCNLLVVNPRKKATHG